MARDRVLLPAPESPPAKVTKTAADRVVSRVNSKPTIKIKPRGSVQAACRECRDKKIKCNDERPTCKNCKRRGTECVWDTEVGQTRSAALKNRSARTEKELGAFIDLHWYLKNRDPNSEVNVEEVLRRGENPQAILDTLRELDGVSSQPTTTISSQESPAIPSPIHETPVRESKPSIWDPELIEASADAYSACIGIMFPVYQPDELEEVLTRFADASDASPISSNTSLPVSKEASRQATLVEVAALTAVGLQYSVNGPHQPKSPNISDDQYLNMSRQHYDYARSCLDQCIETSPMTAIKVLTLLAMWNVINHSSVALAYTDLGIALGMRAGLDSNDLPIDKSLLLLRRTYRTLIMLRGWLSASLNHVPGQCVQAQMQALITASNSSDTDDNEVLQRELTRITVINANTLDVATKFDILDPTVLQSLKEGLLHWYSELPEWLQLNAVLDPGQTRLVGAQIYVACYLHMFYLAAISLKTRIVLSALLDHADDGAPLLASLPTDALQDGLAAARISSQILMLLLDRGMMFPKCWLCTLSSYCTILLLVYADSQRQLQNTGPNMQDLELARQCQRVLQFCATAGPSAKFLNSQVESLLDKLSSDSTAEGFLPDDTLSPCRTEDGAFLLPQAGTNRPILELFCRPFAGYGSEIQMQDTITNLEEVSVGGHLNWCGLFPPSRTTSERERSHDSGVVVDTAPDTPSVPLKERFLQDLDSAVNVDTKGSHGWNILP